MVTWNIIFLQNIIEDELNWRLNSIWQDSDSVFESRICETAVSFLPDNYGHSINWCCADKGRQCLFIYILSSRDASFGTCMYNLNILDCLRAVQKVCHFRVRFVYFPPLLCHAPNEINSLSTGPAVRLARLLQLWCGRVRALREGGKRRLELDHSREVPRLQRAASKKQNRKW